MKNNPLPRLDTEACIREQILPHCRLNPGEVWVDAKSGHRVGCIDATDANAVTSMMQGTQASLAIHDPPYNLVAFDVRNTDEYINWCRRWLANTLSALACDSSLYIWLGADQQNSFQPLPEFMILMREFPFKSRSFITMRNQRGYGTQKNWMAIRQELLYYTRGNAYFDIQAEYTDIPKVLRGYYKEIGDKRQENLERSKSEFIRAGNVWVDIQQVFYRMEENVSGCYAQKPLKCIERIIEASAPQGSCVLDLFAHSGTTLLACERLGRTCFTADIDPVFCEIAIRRLEHFRDTGHLGWQNAHAFEKELPNLSASIAENIPLPFPEIEEETIQGSLF